MHKVSKKIKIKIKITNNKKNKSHAANMTYINAHFPISSGSGMHRVPLNFPWYDSFSKKSVKYELNNVHFEIANTLYNAAVIESQLAEKEQRKTTQSKKTALAHLGRAAGLFQYILEECNPKIVQTMPLDLSTSALKGLSNVMIAQGNQIWFELAKEHNKQVETLKLLANKVLSGYENAYKALQEIESTAPELFSHVQFSYFFWKLTTYYYAGKQEMEVDANMDTPKYGLALDYFEGALGCVGALQQLKCTPEEENAYQSYYADIYYDLKPTASKKNDVWKQKVGQNLPELTNIDRFAPTDMKNWKDEAKVVDEFSKLFPIHIMETKQNYEESKNEKISKGVRMAREHRDFIQSKLTEMGLPGSLMNNDKTTESGFPKEVYDNIKEIHNKGGYNNIKELSETLFQLSQGTKDGIAEIRQLLNEEKSIDDGYRMQYGPRWTTKPSGECARGYVQHLQDLEGKLKTSSQTDQKTSNVIRECAPIWKSLSTSPVELILPSASPTANSEKSAYANELNEKYNNMKKLFDREDTIIGRLKNINDDVEKLFLAQPDQCKNIAAQRLASYDKAIKELERLSVEEDNLLQQIQPLNNQYQQSMDNSELSKKRQKIISDTIDGINRFNNIHASISEGITFYSTMQDNINSMKQSVTDFKFAREKEQQQLLFMLNRPQFHHGIQISSSLQQNQSNMLNELNNQFGRQ